MLSRYRELKRHDMKLAATIAKARRDEREIIFGIMDQIVIEGVGRQPSGEFASPAKDDSLSRLADDPEWDELDEFLSNSPRSRDVVSSGSKSSRSSAVVLSGSESSSSYAVVPFGSCAVDTFDADFADLMRATSTKKSGTVIPPAPVADVDDGWEKELGELSDALSRRAVAPQMSADDDWDQGFAEIEDNIRLGSANDKPLPANMNRKAKKQKVSLERSQNADDVTLAGKGCKAAIHRLKSNAYKRGVNEAKQRGDDKAAQATAGKAAHKLEGEKWA